MKLCIECPEVADPKSQHGSRCTACERARNRARNAQPLRQAYRDKGYRAIPLVGSCADCGATTDLTRDHRIPLARGGTNSPDNIIIRCRKCNSAKGISL